jgi:predicted nucleic acid-binding protein
MIVVADTGPLNYLILIEEVDVLEKLFGRVLVPQAVFQELQHPSTPQMVSDWIKSPSSWLEVKTAPPVQLTAPGLGDGELEAIALAQVENAALLIIDDKRARRFAVQHGLAVVGTLGVLEAAAQRGWIDLPQALTKLEKTSFRLTVALKNELLNRQT